MRKIIVLFLFLSSTAWSQNTMELSLKELIDLAQQGAPDVQIAETQLNNNYWQFRSFLANFRPKIDLTTNQFPNLDRSINVITLDDGTDRFLSRSLMRNSLNLTLEQDIALTGGTVFASTGLQRIDIFSTGGSASGGISYLSTPISIGLRQPLFGFNQLRWDKRIQPLQYEESKRGFSEDVEQVAYDAAELFFTVLIAQLNLEAAIRDKANADTLYAISKGRFEVGRIAETELLQIELSVMNAAADSAQSLLDLQTNTERLRDFLGIQEAVEFQLVAPEEIPVFEIDPERALQMAENNRSTVLAFERRKLEAERNLDQAKKNNGFNADLFASFGLSQSAGNLSEAYRDPLDQEQLVLGINVPIADWGKARARFEIARSNQELVQMRVNQDRVSFQREILIKVQQLELVRNQVTLAQRSREVALRNLGMTRSRYRIGNILVTDLNQAISQEANARRNYFNAVRDFWLAYYDLRRLTLYDFENELPLVRPTDYKED